LPIARASNCFFNNHAIQPNATAHATNRTIRANIFNWNRFFQAALDESLCRVRLAL